MNDPYSTEPDDAYFQHQYEMWMDTIEECLPTVYRVMSSFPGAVVDKVAIKEVVEIAHEADDPEWQYNYDRMIDDLFEAVAVDPLSWHWMRAYDELEPLFPLRVP